MDYEEREDLPMCCQNCQNMETFYDGDDVGGWSCIMNIWWPVKKQSCKKQKPYRAAIKEGE